MMFAVNLPTGTVTFMFTDIEGSTRLVQRLGAEWKGVLEEHNSIAAAALGAHGGVIVRTEGDAVFAVFSGAADAVAAAADFQRGIDGHSWPDEGPVRVRIGIHTGAGTLGGDDYVGIDVHRAARIASAGHGGQVLLSEATATLVERLLDPGLSLRDLGKHRLKDLADREAIFQLVIPGLSDHFPFLNSLERVAHNLPLQVTSFVGRETEMREALRLLEQTRLLTMLGLGGTGKTRLALQVAAEAAEQFEGGAYFVSLASIDDPGLVPSAILSTLGVAASTRSQSPREHLIDFFSTRSALLVLDNFEQILDASDVVAELIRCSARSKVVVTSRVPLRIAGEQEMAIAPLPTNPGRDGAEAIAEVPAVRLFMERAMAVRPDFTLDDTNAAAVLELVARLDGLPLAIELVVAQLRLLPVTAVLERLDTSSLGGGLRDAPERHRTLWNAISTSVDTLSDACGRLYGRLSIFSGGARLDEIEALCGGDTDPGANLFDGLATLVEHSLLMRRDTPHGVRFQMLQVIREHAMERLVLSGEHDEMAARHASAYADLVQAESGNLLRAERKRSLAVLDADHDNLRAAIRWATAHSEVDLAHRIVWAAWRFWQARGHIHEARNILDEVLADGSGTPALRAKALEAAGGLAWWQGRLDEAHAAYLEAEVIQRRDGEPAELANALYNLALTSAFGGFDVERAMPLLAEAEAIFEGLHDLEGLANVHWGRGNLWVMGLIDAEEGQAMLRRSVEEYAAAGNVFGEGWAYYELAWSGFKAGSPGEAREYLERGLRILHGTGDLSAVVMFIMVFAGLALGEGNTERAVRLAGAGYGLRDRLGIDLISIELNRIEGLTAEDLARLTGPLRDAYEQGQAMAPEAAVALALGDPAS